MWYSYVVVRFGIRGRPLLYCSGCEVICYGKGELSECDRLRLCMWSGVGVSQPITPTKLARPLTHHHTTTTLQKGSLPHPKPDHYIVILHLLTLYCCLMPRIKKSNGRLAHCTIWLLTSFFSVPGYKLNVISTLDQGLRNNNN